MEGKRLFVRFQLLLAFVVILSFYVGNADAATGLQPPVKLRWHYYRKTCRYAEEYVRHQVEVYWGKDNSLTAKLMRLLYSDCFVNGCDASVLLDGPYSEKTAPQNRGLEGFVVIDKIKEVLEKRCPGVVSCADILNLATRDAVHLSGGPSYPVFTGRRDGRSSSAASVDLPPPSISLEQGLAYFKSKGLDEVDFVTLIGGGHCVGETHCSYIEDRLYNSSNSGKPDPTMKKSLLDNLRKECPPRTRKDQSDPLVYLNPESKNGYKLSTSCFSRVLNYDAVLGVDQQLPYSNDTLQIVQEFAAGFEDFRKSLALSMSRMGEIGVLTGKDGEIRKKCGSIN
ncbi:hypothetical protein SLE2022_220540 [Rubroshorea leprosula]